MKLVSKLTMIVAAVALINACEAQQGSVVQNLEPAEFNKKIKEVGISLVDVRTAEENAEGHIANAILLDYTAEGFREKAAKLNRDLPVYVYCRSGGRSAKASDVFIELGFKQVYNLAGGITAWQNEGFEVIK